MAVAFDAKATAPNFGSGITGAAGLGDTGLTVSAGSNMCVIYLVEAWGVSGVGVPPASPTGTWDVGGTNQAMTLITSIDNPNGTNDVSVMIFGLVAPVTGNKTFKILWSGANTYGLVLFGMSFSGVNQTGGATTFNNTSTAINSVSSTAVTSNACTTTTNDAVVGIGALLSTSATFSSISGTTAFTQTGQATHFGSAFGSYEVGGASSFTVSATASASTLWAGAATNIAGAAAAPVQRSPFIGGAPLIQMCVPLILGWRTCLEKSIVRVTSRSIIATRRGLLLNKRRLWVPKQSSRPASISSPP